MGGVRLRPARGGYVRDARAAVLELPALPLPPQRRRMVQDVASDDMRRLLGVHGMHFRGDHRVGGDLAEGDYVGLSLQRSRQSLCVYQDRNAPVQPRHTRAREDASLAGYMASSSSLVQRLELHW